MAVRRQVNFSNKPKPDVLSWKHSSQSELIKELIVDMKPEKVASQIPCLPAHMIFMCLRYFCHMTSSSEQAGLFLDGVVSALQQVAQVTALCYEVVLCNVYQFLDPGCAFAKVHYVHYVQVLWLTAGEPGVGDEWFYEHLFLLLLLLLLPPADCSALLPLLLAGQHMSSCQHPVPAHQYWSNQSDQSSSI